MPKIRRLKSEEARIAKSEWAGAVLTVMPLCVRSRKAPEGWRSPGRFATNGCQCARQRPGLRQPSGAFRLPTRNSPRPQLVTSRSAAHVSGPMARRRFQSYVMGHDTGPQRATEAKLGRTASRPPAHLLLRLPRHGDHRGGGFTGRTQAGAKVRSHPDKSPAR